MKPEDFETKLQHDPETGCLLWTGAINKDGRGSVWIDGKWYSAHKYAWLRTFGDVPEGLFVCHDCDTPPCCNTDHLFLGTHQENMDDMKAKSRARGHSLKGVEVTVAKLTEMKVRVIRRLCVDGVRQHKIAAMFGIGQAQVSRIHRRTEWQHVE